MPGGNLDRVLQTKRVSHAADIIAEDVTSEAGKLGGASAPWFTCLWSKTMT